MWWSNKTINSLKCCNSMFHMFHDFVVILYLSYYYHVAIFQGMRNSCCIHRLHHYYSQQSSMKHTQLKMLRMHVSVTMAWWDRWCTCLWNEMQFCRSQTPRVLQAWVQGVRCLKVLHFLAECRPWECGAARNHDSWVVPKVSTSSEPWLVDMGLC